MRALPISPPERVRETAAQGALVCESACESVCACESALPAATVWPRPLELGWQCLSTSPDACASPADWPADGWLAAQVPGTVAAAWRAAGRLDADHPPAFAFDDHWYRLTPQDLESAERYFERALEIDPDYALAHKGMASVWIGRRQFGLISPADAEPQIRAAVQRALEADSTIAEVHFTLAVMRTWTDWDWESAEEAFRRALDLNPNYAEARAFYSHPGWDFPGRTDRGQRLRRSGWHAKAGGENDWRVEIAERRTEI